MSLCCEANIIMSTSCYLSFFFYVFKTFNVHFYNPTKHCHLVFLLEIYL